uniref:NAD(P)(+)--arginine ADP-ribosyltransferase n=1 Tax=Pygocentrus nattereri TaxID=42514 RepID=A0A3B4DVI1_PYGNA
MATMDLYLNSIDDEFMGCKAKMYCVVTEQLLKNELNSNKNFRKDWNAARKKLHLLNIPDSELTETDMTNIALQAYTRPNIYRELNDKMREGRGTYKTKFGLISLHFLMTYGIQTRNAQHECRTTYRRNNIKIEIMFPLVRFGSFASSSIFPNISQFGSETCFKITTCYGADISDISVQPQEAEVLLPPYEVFKSEPVGVKPPERSDCKRVYMLRSVGKVSNMNCEYLKKDKMG